MKLKIPFIKKHPKVAVLRLEGVIASGGRNALSADKLRPMIEQAFRKGKPQAVALVINSPGGSPAQSALIAAHIRALSEELDTPVYAFVEDVAASGGYWLACAADEIYADETSIVGSIGVISASFGFHEALEKLGVERRVHTAGEDKSMLDPFRPEREADVERLKDLQAKIHARFKAYVAERRGERLSQEQDLFTGEIWLGADAVALGLTDGIAHLEPEMKRRFGYKVKFLRYGQKQGLLARLTGAAMQSALQTASERLHWSRFGL